jgi:acyl-coenzyme A synthetase/AMP-(fatty) acid ligase
VPSESSSDDERLAEQLLESTRSRLGSLKTPIWIRLVDADDLPRNALRKVQKRALRDALRTSV